MRDDTNVRWIFARFWLIIFKCTRGAKMCVEKKHETLFYYFLFILFSASFLALVQLLSWLFGDVFRLRLFFFLLSLFFCLTLQPFDSASFAGWVVGWLTGWLTEVQMDRHKFGSQLTSYRQFYSKLIKLLSFLTARKFFIYLDGFAFCVIIILFSEFLFCITNVYLQTHLNTLAHTHTATQPQLNTHAHWQIEIRRLRNVCTQSECAIVCVCVCVTWYFLSRTIETENVQQAFLGTRNASEMYTMFALDIYYIVIQKTKQTHIEAQI